MLETSIPAAGSVQHIEVSDSTVMFAVDEPSLPVTAAATTNGIVPDLIPSGVVHLLNPATLSTIAIKVLVSFL